MLNTCTLNEAVEFIRGITFKPNELIDPRVNGAVVCMRTKNIQLDLDEDDLIAVPKSLVRNPEKYLRPEDTLLSSANSWNLVGKCCYVGELAYPATAGGFISIVRPKKATTHPRFLYHWLSSPRTQHVVRNLGRQTTNISNLDVKRFMQLEFPAFKYEEQRRIASILDSADGIKRKREKAIEAADCFLGSVFHKMFGDPSKNPYKLPQRPLKDCARFVSGATPSKANSAFWGGDFPWVSPKDMKVDIIKDAQDHVTELALEETGLKKIVAGTPLIVVRGMILAHTVPMAMTARDVAINQDMKAIEFASDIDPRFGFWCLKVQQNGILAKIETAAHGTKRLDTSRLGEVQITIAAPNDQQTFVAILQKFEAVRDAISLSHGEAVTMCASLSQRAFGGEI